MPSYYAHYRFGAAAIPLLPSQVQRKVRRFRQVYDVGLHGPDIFFYHNLLFRDKVAAVASQTHELSGEEFFEGVCRRLRLMPNDVAEVYLYGLLTHYCLDSQVHPLVYEAIADGAIGHVELETEFDRYLLQLDGKRQPNTFDCSPHIRLTQGECVTVAQFYPGVRPGALYQSVRGMAAAVKLLAMPNGNFRRFSQQVVGAKTRQHFMGRTPNRSCAHLNGELLSLYEAALAQLPQMLRELQAHMSHGTPLGARFEPSFNG